jgi:hypothetical protein
VDSELLRRIATHEAGHTIACVTFAVPIVGVTVLDRPHLQRGPLPPGLALEIVGTICLAGQAAEEAFCAPLPPGDPGDLFDYEMAERHLRRHVGPLRLSLEFTRLRDSARALVRTSWAKRAIPLLAEALQRCGTLTGDQVNDVLLG